MASSVITIEGNIAGVPDGKLYLADARKWKTPIASTNIKAVSYTHLTLPTTPYV